MEDFSLYTLFIFNIHATFPFENIFINKSIVNFTWKSKKLNSASNSLVPVACRILASFLTITMRRRFQADGEGHGHIMRLGTQCTHFHVMMSSFCRGFLTRLFPDDSGLV